MFRSVFTERPRLNRICKIPRVETWQRGNQRRLLWERWSIDGNIWNGLRNTESSLRWRKYPVGVKGGDGVKVELKRRRVEPQSILKYSNTVGINVERNTIVYKSFDITYYEFPFLVCENSVWSGLNVGTENSFSLIKKT